MSKFFVATSMSIVILLSSNDQIFGMQFQKKECSSSTLLLECSSEVKGDSLLKQNRYFTQLVPYISYFSNGLPPVITLKDQIHSLTNKIRQGIFQGMSHSTLNKLPSEIQLKIIECFENPLKMKYVNKGFNIAIKNLCKRNFLLTSQIKKTADLEQLCTMYVPLLLVETCKTFCEVCPDKTCCEACPNDLHYTCQHGFLDNHKEAIFLISPYKNGFYLNGSNSRCITGCSYFNSNNIFDIKEEDVPLFVPLLKSTFELGCKRRDQLCQEVSYDIVHNSMIVTAVLYGDSITLIKLLQNDRDSFFSIFDALVAAIKYPNNNQMIMPLLLGKLKFLCNSRKYGYRKKDGKNRFYYLLYLANKYDNKIAFNAIAKLDPYSIKKETFDMKGVCKTMLDIVIEEGHLNPENIEKLRLAGYMCNI